MEKRNALLPQGEQNSHSETQDPQSLAIFLKEAGVITQDRWDEINSRNYDSDIRIVSKLVSVLNDLKLQEYEGYYLKGEEKVKVCSCRGCSGTREQQAKTVISLYNEIMLDYDPKSYCEVVRKGKNWEVKNRNEVDSVK